MRHHKEEAEQRLRAMVANKNLDFSAPSHNAAFQNRGPSPPMLGADLVLPQSESPEGTLCEEPSTETDAQGQQALVMTAADFGVPGPSPMRAAAQVFGWVHAARPMVLSEAHK